MGRTQFNLLERHFSEHMKMPDSTEKSGGLATLTQIESADGQRRRTPLGAFTVGRMRMCADDILSTVRLWWHTGVNILPRDMQATNQMSFLSIRNPHTPCHCHPISALNHCRSDCQNMRVRGNLPAVPQAHFNAACSVRVGSQLPSEESLLWRQR